MSPEGTDHSEAIDHASSKLTIYIMPLRVSLPWPVKRNVPLIVSEKPRRGTRRHPPSRSASQSQQNINQRQQAAKREKYCCIHLGRWEMIP